MQMELLILPWNLTVSNFNPFLTSVGERSPEQETTPSFELFVFVFVENISECETPDWKSTKVEG